MGVAMGVELRLRMSREAADKLLKAWNDGRLDHLNIADITPVELDRPEQADRKWTESEATRREVPQRDESPPRE
jgi:hypothetical protein